MFKERICTCTWSSLMCRCSWLQQTFRLTFQQIQIPQTGTTKIKTILWYTKWWLIQIWGTMMPSLAFLVLSMMYECLIVLNTRNLLIVYSVWMVLQNKCSELMSRNLAAKNLFRTSGGQGKHLDKRKKHHKKFPRVKRNSLQIVSQYDPNCSSWIES